MFERGRSDELFTDTLDLLEMLNNRGGQFEYADYVALHNNITALYDSFSEVDESIELAKAKAEGRLVELPCKVGDTVYVLMRRNHTTEVVKGTVRNVRRYNDDAWWVEFWGLWVDITFEDFGKIAFLSREAAEKALEESLLKNKEE